MVAFGLEDTQDEHYGAPILATCEYYRLAGCSFLHDKMLLIQAKRHQTLRKTQLVATLFSVITKQPDKFLHQYGKVTLPCPRKSYLTAQSLAEFSEATLTALCRLELVICMPLPSFQRVSLARAPL